MVEISCVVAAVCFMAANVMKIIFYVKEHRRSHFDWDAYTALDPDYLQEDWDFRLSKKGLFLSSGFLNAIAWLFFAYPIIQMAWLLSRQGTKGIAVNVSIIMFALGGALTEWLSHLFWIGMNVASTHLVNNFNLDNWLRSDIAINVGAAEDGMGWRSLEVNHIIGSGFVWLTDSFEWLCLCGVLICTFVSVRQWRKEDKTSFGARWNSLSLFIGLLCLLEFVAEILRFEGFKYYGPVALIYAVLNRLLLIPAWIISLGFMLPRATMKQAYANSSNSNSNSNSAGTNNMDSELALTEMNVTMEQSPQFTIEDEDAVTSPPPPPEAFSIPPGEKL